MSQTDRNGLTNDPTAPPTVMVWKGAWVIATEYAYYNLVSFDGTTYICVVGHTSSASFSSELLLGYWAIFAAKGLSGSGSGDMVAANNLSEVDPTTARGNLGATEAGVNTTITGLSGLLTLTVSETPIEADDQVFFQDTSDGNKIKRASAASFIARSTGFPSTTRMAFNQTSAPTGWTKDTTAALNDSIMRIVVGTVGSGGATAFSTFNGQAATGAYTLTTSDIPQINLEGYGNTAGTPTANGYSTGVIGDNPVSKASSPAWVTIPRTAFAQAIRIQDLGGGAHAHSMTTDIKYRDFIIAVRD